MRTEQARTNARIYLFMIIVLAVGTYILFPNVHRDLIAWTRNLMYDVGF